MPAFTRCRPPVRMLAALLCCLAAAAPPVICRADPVPTELVGRVVDQQGRVTVWRGGESVSLAPEAPIYRTDSIRTEPAARIKLRFLDGTIVALGSETRMVVTEYLPERTPASRLLDLIQGILRATVSATREGAGFDVRTRTAVASARSTDWVIESKAETSAVFVVEGRVVVKSIGAPDEVTLGPGEGTDVAAGSPPKEPAEWGRARVDEFLTRTSVPGTR